MVDRVQRPYDIAAAQQGYFTAKQAGSVGYSESMCSYHVKRGHWERVGRGIYRLKRFPWSREEQFVVWSLWSRDRADQPQGVYSHQTALSIYELSDVMPRELHRRDIANWRQDGEIKQDLFETLIKEAGIE